jgi:hypothetical protein
VKAPYWFVAEGRGFSLLERGEPTGVRYANIEEAKRSVLALNDEWRKKHPKKQKAARGKK